MKFIVRLFIQKHHNRTYTVLAPAFPDISAYGPTLEECKQEIAEALAEHLAEVEPQYLHYAAFRPNQTLEKVTVELRPVDARGRRRRDMVQITLNLLLTQEEEGQTLVTAPVLRSPPLSFYLARREELAEVAQLEVAQYFHELPFEAIVAQRAARQEALDTLEVEFKPKKALDKRKEVEEERFWALKASGTNLSAQAAEGQLRRAYRREREVEHLLNALAGERHPSILLIGESGVGKTAVVHETVRRIRRKECPESLQDRQVWSVTGATLIAGCSFLGQWQEKLTDLVREVRKKRHLLFIEDIAALVEVGRWSKGDENMAEFLKPFLQSGDVVIIGESTQARLRQAEQLNPGFVAQFRTLAITPPNEADTLSILTAVARGLERNEEIRIEPGALEAAVELTNRFLPYRMQPGKAITLLEQLATDSGRTAQAGPDAPKPVLTRKQVVTGFSRQSGLPEFMVADNIPLDLAAVQAHFADRIIGQSAAVQAMVDLIAVIKAGLQDPAKPLGVFLFIGPTGVGKTQLAKTLADYLFGDAKRLVRFDMSEYNDSAAVRRLIGLPGADQAGELTGQVRKQSFCVVLLDEFEKAHPQIYDIFLQVFGEGRLTDATGHTTSFQNSVILLTSNLGAGAREQRAVGLPIQSAKSGVLSPQSAAPGGDVLPDAGLRATDAGYWQRKIEQFFRPEFINRLDQIVVFQALPEEAMRQIARREIGEVLLREGFIRRNVLVEIDDNVIDLLLQEGFNPTYGARPLKRAVERLLVLPLARYLAGRGQTEVDLIRLQCEEGAVTLRTQRYAESERNVTVQLGEGLLSTGSKRQRLDERGLIEGFATLRRRLADWSEHELLLEMINERTKLLAATQQPTFWDDGEAARRAMGRFYFLDRLLKRLQQLQDRAEYLEELAGLVQRERNPGYRNDLAQSYTQLDRDFAFLDIELLCAHLTENHGAFLLLKRVGAPAEESTHWLTQLATIYLHWSRRKGYEVHVATLEPALPDRQRHVKANLAAPPAIYHPKVLNLEPIDALIKAVAAVEPVNILGIVLQGTNVFGFLKGERGVHRHNEVRPSGERAQSLVEVAVYSLTGEVATTLLKGPIDLSATGEALVSDNETGKGSKVKAVPGVRRSTQPPTNNIIRTYQFEGERSVRDLRTGIKSTNTTAVLEGELDEFILAYLREEEGKHAWAEG